MRFNLPTKTLLTGLIFVLAIFLLSGCANKFVEDKSDKPSIATLSDISKKEESSEDTDALQSKMEEQQDEIEVLKDQLQSEKEIEKITQDQQKTNESIKLSNKEELITQDDEKVDCLKYGNFKNNKTTGAIEFYETSVSVSQSDCELIKQKNERTKEIINEYNKATKKIDDWENDCLMGSAVYSQEECFSESLSANTKLTMETLSKLGSLWR